MQPPPVTSGVVWRRASRPVLWWCVASALLFLWRFHSGQARKATMQFTVSMEKRTRPIRHETTLNGLAYTPGEPCGVGWKKLAIQAEDAEPFATNRFVWYGGAAFGDIALRRSRGRLDLEFSPAVERVRIIGNEENTTLTNVTRELLSLPTGRYTVEAQYARFKVERTAEVARNETNRVRIAPSISTLDLSSDPDKAEFELISTKPSEVSVSGRTPATLAGLPAGDYALAIWRGDYRKNLSVSLAGTTPTNELRVEFRYAKLSIVSDPAGAVISDGSRVLGKTPANLEMQPGAYQLQIAKDGYFATNVSLTLSETDTRAVSVSLPNVSFAQAIDRARNQSSGFAPDFDRALADVEQALQIKPGDETALQLKRTIEFRRHLKLAKQFQAGGDFGRAISEADAALGLTANDADALALKGELLNAKLAADERQAKVQQAALTAQAEARRNRPQKLAEETASRIRYHELFQTQLMRFNGSADTVHAAVSRALARKPEWAVRLDNKLDAEAVVMQAEKKGFGSRHNVVLAVGQTADTEVTVCFKLLSFTLGENVQLSLSGISDDSYKPLHPQFVPPARVASVESSRARDIQELKKRIEEELR